MSKNAPSLLISMKLAGERAGQVEPEAVDVHLRDPVAQAVHDELEDARVRHVGHVAASGEVHVEPAVLGRQHVIRDVVDPLHRQGRPEVVPLGRVVVDHVEDHLDPGLVEGLDHRLELAHGVRSGIAIIGREEPEAVVAPVIDQIFFLEVTVVDVIMDRQEFDGRDAQPGHVLDGGGAGQTRVGPSERLRDARHLLGEAL